MVGGVSLDVQLIFYCNVTGWQFLFSLSQEQIRISG